MARCITRCLVESIGAKHSPAILIAHGCACRGRATSTFVPTWNTLNIAWQNTGGMPVEDVIAFHVLLAQVLMLQHYIHTEPGPGIHNRITAS
jgi:hypothetical protein